MERDTLEHQLFDWEEWNEVQTGDLQFFDVTLKVPVGQFEAGTKFSAAYVLGSQSTLVLQNEKDEEFCYDLKVSVGDSFVSEKPAPSEKGCNCGHAH